MSQQGDPLAELHDIHLPPPVDAWPPAPGWWILAIVIVAALVALVLWMFRRWRANQYRREALKELANLRRAYDQYADEAAWLLDYEALLKRVALTRYPRAEVASLTGEAWVAFLDNTIGSHEFSMGPGQVLIDGHYRPASELNAGIDVDALHELGKQWIKRHGDRRQEAP